MTENGNYSEFAMDILKGLTAKVKYIPTKYHYDTNGSKIFQEIMNLPEYYPTFCEFEIISLKSKEILDKLKFSEKFNIVELGCGDGLKTIELLRIFESANADFTYVPIDISEEALISMEKRVKITLPKIKMDSKIGDYFFVLEEIPLEKEQNLFLILGGNIGNYTRDEAVDFLKQVSTHMHKGDKLLVGFDLQKSPPVVHKAYDDSAGVTKAFTMNLLERISVELEADVNQQQFDFYSCYNPENGEVRCYLYSLCKQTFRSKKLKISFNFEAGETILTELSLKYKLNDIEKLASDVGFKLIENFLDSKQYVTDSLWEKL